MTDTHDVAVVVVEFSSMIALLPRYGDSMLLNANRKAEAERENDGEREQMRG